MGIECSKLKPTLLKDLKSNTYFSGKEIRDWFKFFSQDCPSGQMTKEQFRALFLRCYPVSDATEFADHVFRTFDTNGDGVINFREFMCLLSVIARGDPDEKLEWIFSMCDVDGNGYITKEDMFTILCVLHKAMEPGTVVEEPETLTQKIFLALDSNQDGRISFEEFIEGTKNPDLRNLLNTEREYQ